MERLLVGWLESDDCTDHNVKSKSYIYKDYDDEYGRHFCPGSGGGVTFAFLSCIWTHTRASGWLNNISLSLRFKISYLSNLSTF